MRPTRLVLFLAALLLLAPVPALAGKGGGGGGGGATLDNPVDGDYFFLDKVSADKIKSVATVDAKAGSFCLNGIATYLDTTVTLNRRVEFEFFSDGDIEKSGPGRVDGLFTSSSLTLNVYAGPSVVLFPIIFTSTLNPAPCELDAQLSKIGVDGDGNPTGKINADLVCELGPFLDTMGAPEEIANNVAFALDKKKSIRFRLTTGDFRINHNGFRVDPIADGLDFATLDSCSAPPPPPPPE